MNKHILPPPTREEQAPIAEHHEECGESPPHEFMFRADGLPRPFAGPWLYKRETEVGACSCDRACWC